MKRYYYLFVFLMVFNTCVLYAEDIFPGSDIIEMPPGPFESEVDIRFEPDPEDWDNDGLKNAEEERYGTDPNDPDTDNDGLIDLIEVTNGTDPNGNNTLDYLEVIDIESEDKIETFSEDIIDADDLSEETENADEYTDIIPPIFDDEEELYLHSDYENNNISKESFNDLADEENNQEAMLNRTSIGPDLTPIYMLLLLGDNDGDGMDDDWEVRYFGSTDACDPEDDPDEDNLSNLNEYNNHTDPNNPDSDGEGLTDGFEVLNGLNPNDIDTDDDELTDSWEVTNNLDPKDPDMDDDGLLDGAEITAGTDPNDSDTDDDGMPDLWEVTSGTNAIVNDRNVDMDSDLYSNLMEYVFHSDPSDPNDVPENASKGSYYEYDELGRIKSIIRAK
jgi:hypothetical protein